MQETAIGSTAKTESGIPKQLLAPSGTGWMSGPRAVSIFEGQEFILISGQEHENTFDCSGYAHFEQLLYVNEIKQMLDEAFRRRRKSSDPEPSSSNPGVAMSRTWRKLNSLIKE